MCFVLYMASDRERAVIPWDEKNLNFHVTANDSDALKASQHFTKKNIYYLGSDNGCGCGFRRETDGYIDDPKELASKAENHRNLHNYLKECLKDEQTIELFSCWSGDETDKVEHRQEIALSDLLRPEFIFLEHQFTIVTIGEPDAAPNFEGSAPSK